MKQDTMSYEKDHNMEVSLLWLQQYLDMDKLEKRKMRNVDMSA